MGKRDIPEDYQWFKFYTKWIDAFVALSKPELDNLLEAIRAFINDEEMPEFIYADEIVFILIKDSLEKDRDRIRKIKRTIEKNGENNFIRHSKEYSEWRKAVFKRDGYECQLCGKHGGKLNAHHKERFVDCPEKRLDIDNGITLCEDCHKQVHHLKITLD